MDSHELSQLTEIAVRAMIESMASQQHEQDENIKQAIHHYDDETFRTLLHSVANGFDQRLVDIGLRVGLVLIAQNKDSPFAPGLSWISARLASNIKTLSTTLRIGNDHRMDPSTTGTRFTHFGCRLPK